MTISAFGGVVVNNVVYVEQELLTIREQQPQTALKYGENWVYAGDLPMEECDIYVIDHNGREHIFEGVTGLNDFLSWYESIKR